MTVRRPTLPEGISASRISPRHLIGEAITGILQRPGRTALTALGTVLGIGSFVAVVGISTTANSQITERFNALSATEVTVEQVAADDGNALAFPNDADARVSRLNGVVAAGTYWDAGSQRRVSTTGPWGGEPPEAGVVSVTAASPGYWNAIHPSVRGRVYDQFLATQRVAVVGAGIAEQLELADVTTRPAVFIDGVAFTVVGIVSDTRRSADSLLSVTVPTQAALELWGVPETAARMVVETTPGAAAVVAEQAPLALRPDAPQHFIAVAPVDPTELRNGVSDDLQVMLLALAGICLVIGAVGIANTTLVAVLERIPEIGLRRALGALPRHIAAQFILESSIVGGLGGLIGASAGVTTVVVVAIFQQWTATIPVWAAVTAPAVGVAIGTVAGLYPAWRGARIEPIEAFRR